MSEQPNFYGKGEPLMEAAFAQCVQWTWKQPTMRREFERKTGMKLAPHGIAAMIDEATGYDEEIAQAFVRFVITDVWGEA